MVVKNILHLEEGMKRSTMKKVRDGCIFACCGGNEKGPDFRAASTSARPLFK